MYTGRECAGFDTYFCSRPAGGQCLHTTVYIYATKYAIELQVDSHHVTVHDLPKGEWWESHDRPEWPTDGEIMLGCGDWLKAVEGQRWT